MINRVLCFFYYRLYKRCVNYISIKSFVKELGHFEETAQIRLPSVCSCPRKVFLYDNTNIFEDSILIISPVGEKGRFIMKKNSGAAQKLTVITGNHGREKCHLFKELSVSHKMDVDKDVIVEEDVWLGANVTLLSGVTVGRGATVGAGSVCIKSVPPYAVVMGNPAKVVGFNFTPEEIIEHEKALYSEEERLPVELLEKNYNKYFINRTKEIKEFTKL